MITGDCEHTWAKCGSYDRVKLLFRLRFPDTACVKMEDVLLFRIAVIFHSLVKSVVLLFLVWIALFLMSLSVQILQRGVLEV